MWLFLVELGFVGFLASLFGLVWRGFDRRGALQRGGPWWLLAAALFFCLWAAALPRVPRPDQAVQAEAVRSH